MTMAHTKTRTEPISRAEKLKAVHDFLSGAVVPSYAFTKRVRDLPWTEARDIVFGLHGLHFQPDDSVADKFTAKRDADGNVVVPPPPKPSAHPDKSAALFGVRPDKICGVQF